MKSTSFYVILVALWWSVFKLLRSEREEEGGRGGGGVGLRSPSPQICYCICKIILSLPHIWGCPSPFRLYSEKLFLRPSIPKISPKAWYSWNTRSTLGTADTLGTLGKAGRLKSSPCFIFSCYSVHLHIWHHFLRYVLLLTLTSQSEETCRYLTSRRLMCLDKHLVTPETTQSTFSTLKRCYFKKY